MILAVRVEHRRDESFSARRSTSLRTNGAGLREAGFTLVEMLAVLAVIGVAAGATALGIGAATRAPSAEAEARRLSARIQAAADEAMVADRTLGLAWDGRGYSVVALDGGPPLSGGGAQRTTLPAGMTLAVTGAASPMTLGSDGGGVPFAASLANATDRWRIGYDGLRATAIRAPSG